MALIDTGNDPWLVEHNACEQSAHDILELLSQRDAEEKTSRAYDALSAKIRVRLRQYSSEVKSLDDKLNLASVVSTITLEELERRRRQAEILKSKEIQLQERYSRGTKDFSRSQLFNTQTSRGPVFADMGTTGWGDVQETEETVHQGVSDLRSEQQRLLREQDEGLDILSKVISRQKHIATSINTEVDEQNDILVDITDGIDRTNERIRNETEMVHVITRTDSVWGYWLVIGLLFLAIIIVVAT